MKKPFTLFAIAFLAVASPVLQTGCQSSAPVTLAAGGIYSDPVLASADQAILDASRAFNAFILWHDANAVWLRRWPEIGQLATNTSALKDGWIRDAYAARDAYALAAQAYRQGAVSADESDKKRAALKAAIVYLNNITTHIVQKQQERSTP